MVRLVPAVRLAALVAVAALFAALVYRLAQPDRGAALTRAVRTHRAPAVPDLSFRLLWRDASTWPTGLRPLAARNTISIRDLRGYPVVVNFWSSWCDACKREASVLASAAKARHGEVAFLAVDVNDHAADATRFLRGHHVPYVAVRSGSAAIERFGLIGLPETFYVDRNGRIRNLTRGELSASSLERALGAMRPGPAPPRAQS
jgi:cytochrome c biogenesis protein CcmG, thiol:disulfide interchange protein DsbE